jgi:hypothetical protein
MRWLLIVALGLGCTASRMTHYRSGWRSCQAADPNVIQCGGKPMAKVECFQPSDETCGALAVNYADGEQVFLWRPAGFVPGPDAPLEPGGVIRPELASDGSMIWFKSAQGGRGDTWTIFEPETGITREVDSFRMFQIREKDPHSMPLWVVATK